MPPKKRVKGVKPPFKPPAVSDPLHGFAWFQTYNYLERVGGRRWLGRDIATLIQRYLKRSLESGRTVVIPLALDTAPIVYDGTANAWSLMDRKDLLETVGRTSCAVYELERMARRFWQPGWDPETQTVPVPLPNINRFGFAVCALPCGDALICGGARRGDDEYASYEYLDSAEILDVKTMQWRAFIPRFMKMKVNWGVAVALSDNQVVVASGMDPWGVLHPLNFVQVCTFTHTSACEVKRYPYTRSISLNGAASGIFLTADREYCLWGMRMRLISCDRYITVTRFGARPGKLNRHDTVTSDRLDVRACFRLPGSASIVACGGSSGPATQLRTCHIVGYGPTLAIPDMPHDVGYDPVIIEGKGAGPPSTPDIKFV